MFSTQPVTGPAYLVVAALVGMVVFVVGKTDRIENQTVMNMPLINMGGKYKLVLADVYKRQPPGRCPGSRPIV